MLGSDSHLFGLIFAGSTETCVGFAPDVVIAGRSCV
jgi:hypothetical protein